VSRLGATMRLLQYMKGIISTVIRWYYECDHGYCYYLVSACQALRMLYPDSARNWTHSQYAACSSITDHLVFEHTMRLKTTLSSSMPTACLRGVGDHASYLTCCTINDGVACNRHGRSFSATRYCFLLQLSMQYTLMTRRPRQARCSTY
jgi:hypothetical protein